MELKDPVTGEVTTLTAPKEAVESQVATDETEWIEKSPEVKALEARLEAHKKLDELQNGRPLDEIPLSDEYYKFKSENQHKF